MKVLREPAELLAGSGKVCLAIGVFDGVHLGHQQVIRQTLSDARQQEAEAVIVTFDRHPGSVVAPERAPQMIYPLDKKLSVIAGMGADATLVIPFDQAFSRTSGETFVRDLQRGFGSIFSICVGSNFTFGHKRSGNVELLRRMGEDLQFKVHGLAAVSLDSIPVSSTRIRDAIRSGDLDSAGQMLGRDYTISGLVVAGRKLGRTIGFPTANLDVASLVLPPNGVYVAHATVGESRERLRAVVNIGRRPTIDSAANKVHVEAHFLNFSGDLYNQRVELNLSAKLREEQRFDSVDQLKAQIENDIAHARALFHSPAS